MDANELRITKYALKEGSIESAISFRLQMLNIQTGKRRDEACRLADAYWRAVMEPASAKQMVKEAEKNIRLRKIIEAEADEAQRLENEIRQAENSASDPAAGAKTSAD